MEEVELGYLGGEGRGCGELYILSNARTSKGGHFAQTLSQPQCPLVCRLVVSVAARRAVVGSQKVICR